VALISVAISVFFGTQAGLVLARQRGRIVRSLELLIYLLLLVPEIVLAVASLLFVVRLRIPLGIVPLAAAHSSFSIAVIALIVRARALMIDPATEESSADLGAGAMRTFWSVTLPQLRPAVVAGAILAFTFSFDNLVISLFLTTPTVTTLPVYIFGNAHNGLTPDLYAVTTTLMAFTLLTIALFAVVYRWQQRDLGDKRSFTDVLTAKAPASAVPA
jgi:ABC-type spermidine/putrescine transport system permease subunit II